MTRESVGCCICRFNWCLYNCLFSFFLLQGVPLSSSSTVSMFSFSSNVFLVSLQHCFGFLSSSNCSSMSSCFSAFFFLQCVPLSYSNTVSMFSSSTNNVTLFPSGTVSMLSFFSKVFLCRSQSCFYAFFLILNLHLQFSCLLFFCCHHPPLLSPQLYLPSLLFTSSSSALPP